MLGYNNSALNPTSNVKASETRIITGINAATGVVNWGGPSNADGLGPTSIPWRLAWRRRTGGITPGC